jgi:hypothetical protein
LQDLDLDFLLEQPPKLLLQAALAFTTVTRHPEAHAAQLTSFTSTVSLGRRQMSSPDAFRIAPYLLESVAGDLLEGWDGVSWDATSGALGGGPDEAAEDESSLSSASAEEEDVREMVRAEVGSAVQVGMQALADQLRGELHEAVFGLSAQLREATSHREVQAGNEAVAPPVPRGHEQDGVPPLVPRERGPDEVLSPRSGGSEAPSRSELEDLRRKLSSLQEEVAQRDALQAAERRLDRLTGRNLPPAKSDVGARNDHERDFLLMLLDAAGGRFADDPITSLAVVRELVTYRLFLLRLAGSYSWEAAAHGAGEVDPFAWLKDPVTAEAKLSAAVLAKEKEVAKRRKELQKEKEKEKEEKERKEKAASVARQQPRLLFCYICGAQDHISYACPSKRTGSQPRGGFGSRNPPLYQWQRPDGPQASTIHQPTQPAQ